MKREGVEVVAPAAVRSMCVNILNLMSTTVEVMEDVSIVVIEKNALFPNIVSNSNVENQNHALFLLFSTKIFLFLLLFFVRFYGHIFCSFSYRLNLHLPLCLSARLWQTLLRGSGKQTMQIIISLTWKMVMIGLRR